MDVRALAVGIGIAFLAMMLALRARRWARSVRAKRRARAALHGERVARRVLESHGYAVSDAQARGALVLALDGASTSHALRADYLVEREGRRYVAEVKTGRLAPRIDHAPTRRQLLEYRVAFDVDGVLLVDAESERVHEIVFPERSVKHVAWMPILALGIALGALFTLALSR